MAAGREDFLAFERRQTGPISGKKRFGKHGAVTISTPVRASGLAWLDSTPSLFSASVDATPAVRPIEADRWSLLRGPLGIFFGIWALTAILYACQQGGDLVTSLCTIFCEKYDYPAPLPAHVAGSWLTKTPQQGTRPTNAADAQSAGNAYYSAVDPNNAKDTFDKWKTANRFGGPDEVVTYYYNAGDLDFGREMHCRQESANLPLGKSVATYCYVTNYAPGPNPKQDTVLNPPLPPNLSAAEQTVKRALDRATAHDVTQGFATVAMESLHLELPSIRADNVTFYVFSQPDGVRQPTAALDNEGQKAVPAMCMTCHGGSYDYGTHAVANASFLPFDLQSFRFSTTSGFTRADQDEGFRKQNQMVRDSGTASEGIVRTINLLYPHGVQTPGFPPANDLVPPGWQGAGHDDLYLYVVRPYCRSCHQAQTPYAPQYEWSTYQQFVDAAGLIASDVCNVHVMPNAEIPFFKYWQLDAVQRGPEILAKWLTSPNLNLTCVVPTPAPTTPPSPTP